MAAFGFDERLCPIDRVVRRPLMDIDGRSGQKTQVFFAVKIGRSIPLCVRRIENAGDCYHWISGLPVIAEKTTVLGGQAGEHGRVGHQGFRGGACSCP